MLTAEDVRNGCADKCEDDELQIVESKLRYETRRISRFKEYGVGTKMVSGLLHGGHLKQSTIRNLESRGFKVKLSKTLDSIYTEIMW